MRMSSAQHLSCEAPQEVSTPPQNSSYTQNTHSVRKDSEIPQGVAPTDTHEAQRSYLQATSKNNFKGVLPKDVNEASASNLSKGWKRVKKRVGNCFETSMLLPATLTKSHVFQIEVAALEGKSSAVIHS